MAGDRINFVKSTAKTIDDLVDAVIGGRPVTRLLGVLEGIAPANVVRKLGAPAPGDVVDQAVAQVEYAVKAGRPPVPPTPAVMPGMRRRRGSLVKRRWQAR